MQFVKIVREARAASKIQSCFKIKKARVGTSGKSFGKRMAQAAQAAPATKSEYVEDEDEPEGQWLASKWLSGLGLTKAITKALKVPGRDSEISPFDYVRRLKSHEVEALLSDASLSGLSDALKQGIADLQKQKSSSGAALNDKFQTSGKFQMSYGSLSLFYGGLESLLGPPQMHKDPERPEAPPTLYRAMENEHKAGPEATEEFSTSNGMSTTPSTEWEFVTHPVKSTSYPERIELRETHPEWCRTPKSQEKMLEVMEVEVNEKLRKAGHAEMMVEEMLAGREWLPPSPFRPPFRPAPPLRSAPPLRPSAPPLRPAPFPLAPYDVACRPLLPPRRMRGARCAIEVTGCVACLSTLDAPYRAVYRTK